MFQEGQFNWWLEISGESIGWGSGREVWGQPLPAHMPPYAVHTSYFRGPVGRLTITIVRTFST